MFTESGEETWEYTYTSSKVRAASFIPIVGPLAGGSDIESYTFTIRFGKDGLVKNSGRGKTTGGSVLGH